MTSGGDACRIWDGRFDGSSHILPSIPTLLQISQRAEYWGVVLALWAFSGIHVGIDSLNVLYGVARLLAGANKGPLFPLLVMAIFFPPHTLRLNSWLQIVKKHGLTQDGKMLCRNGTGGWRKDGGDASALGWVWQTVGDPRCSRVISGTHEEGARWKDLRKVEVKSSVFFFNLLLRRFLQNVCLSEGLTPFSQPQFPRSTVLVMFFFRIALRRIEVLRVRSGGWNVCFVSELVLGLLGGRWTQLNLWVCR